jgi:hypothetical protein
VTSDGGIVKSSELALSPKTPPLPTPPLRRETDTGGNFEEEMEKALGKVGNGGKSPEVDKEPPPLLELSIPIGLH